MSHIFIYIHIIDYHPFVSAYRTPFSISYKTGLVLFIRKNLYLTFTSKGQPCRVKYSWLKVSFFQHFEYNISFSTGRQSLLRNSLMALWRFPCMREYFSLAAFVIILFSLVLDSFIIMSIGDHIELKFEVSISFMIGYLNLSLIWEVISHYFFFILNTF